MTDSDQSVADTQAFRMLEHQIAAIHTTAAAGNTPIAGGQVLFLCLLGIIAVSSGAMHYFQFGVTKQNTTAIEHLVESSATKVLERQQIEFATLTQELREAASDRYRGSDQTAFEDSLRLQNEGLIVPHWKDVKNEGEKSGT